jgi:transposase
MDAGSEPDAAGEGTQGAVGELGSVSGGRSAPEGVPDPELVERASRRRLSAAYKLSIVHEADACSKPGEIGALTRNGSCAAHRGRLRYRPPRGSTSPTPRRPKPKFTTTVSHPT